MPLCMKVETSRELMKLLPYNFDSEDLDLQGQPAKTKSSPKLIADK